MKKIIMFLILLIVCIMPNYIYAEVDEDIMKMQKDELNISAFIEEADKYSSNVFEDINYKELFASALKGNIDNEKLGKSLLNLLGKETITSIRTIASVIIIIIIHSVLKSISDGLENKSIGEITYYIQYILIVTIIMVNFSDIINMLKTSINNLIGFSNALIPLLTTLIITTGNIASASIMEPILIIIITFMGNLINIVILPIALTATSLSIVSKVSEKVQIGKLSKFFKSGITWVLIVILTIFVGAISIEGNLSSSVDGISAKTAKAAVSNFVPIVGKILSDSVDTVIGCANILKNAVGIVGVITIIGICILPILKILSLMIVYYIGAAICEPIADRKIVGLLGEMGDTFKILLAILCSISVMIIIGVTIVIKISNSGLMYR